MLGSSSTTRTRWPACATRQAIAPAAPHARGRLPNPYLPHPAPYPRALNVGPWLATKGGGMTPRAAFGLAAILAATVVTGAVAMTGIAPRARHAGRGRHRAARERRASPPGARDP